MLDFKAWLKSHKESTWQNGKGSSLEIFLFEKVKGQRE